MDTPFEFNINSSPFEAENPEEVVARGMGITLNNIDVLKKTVKNRRR